MTSNSSPADEFQSERNSRSASRSRAQTPPPRPTTPLRPPSRNSLRSSQTPTHGGVADGNGPIAALEGPFGELSDSMADLEANFVHLQLMHESLARFSECFASFLYGLNVNAFCVDFPEAPVPESFRRARDDPGFSQPIVNAGTYGSTDPSLDPDQTFLTTDTSFVENPPASTKPQFSQPITPGRKATTTAFGSTTSTSTARGARGMRGATTASRGTQRARGQPSGLARATSRGTASYGR